MSLPPPWMRRSLRPSRSSSTSELTKTARQSTATRAGFPRGGTSRGRAPFTSWSNGDKARRSRPQVPDSSVGAAPRGYGDRPLYQVASDQPYAIVKVERRRHLRRKQHDPVSKLDRPLAAQEGMLLVDLEHRGTRQKGLGQSVLAPDGFASGVEHRSVGGGADDRREHRAGALEGKVETVQVGLHYRVGSCLDLSQHWRPQALVEGG